MRKLKTLKDIKGQFHIIALDERTPRSNLPVAKVEFNNQEIMYGYEMSNNGIFLKVDDLRKEAINWIKYYKKMLSAGKGDPKDWIEGKIQVLEDFFNISQEELI